MQNDQGVGVANNLINQQPTGGAPPVPIVGDTAGAPQAMPPPVAAKTPFKLRSSKRWLWIALGAIVGLFVIGGIIVVLNFKSSAQEQQVLSGSFKSIQIPLDDLTANSIADADANSLKVNGQLQLSGSMALTPTVQPQNPAKGQLYFDQGANQLRYYDGQQFVTAGGTSNTTNNTVNNSTTNNTTNVTNIFNTLAGSNDVNLQGSTPGLQQNGNFNISGTGQVGTLRTGTVSNGGDLSVTTDAASGTTGNITIKSGDSSTTASGNITVDAGNGIIDGEVVADKTFESGLDNMQDWFNTTIATTTEQAHSGIQSLKMTPSSNFWGIIEILPGTPVTPGHQYHFSIWVRAAATGRTVGGLVDWQGTGGVTTSFTSITDSTTGWTEMSLTAPAPAGANSVVIKVNSSTGIAGEAHYFDDMTITDLSSSSAFSSIDIGTVNAKVITIGNMNQIGATSILGSSGVTLNGGAGNLTMAGGTVGLTGNGASAINTTTGALTITSADAATWSVGASSTGAGGDLTLHAGKGAFGNNNGGSLVLQGGASTGTGTGGSVVVRPLADSTNAFQIQNSSSVALFTADSTGMRIVVSGSGGVFANLVLQDSHFSSTQTTAPMINTPTDCGTGPAAAVTAGSTDTAGSFTITTGLGGTSAACDTTITFNHAYGATPKSIIVVGNSDALSVARQVYVSNSNATTFTVRFATSTAGANNQMYSFNYWVVE